MRLRPIYKRRARGLARILARFRWFRRLVAWDYLRNKRAAEREIQERIRQLTPSRERLSELAKRYPPPASFWDDDA